MKAFILVTSSCFAASCLDVRAELPQYSVTPLDSTWIPSGFLASGLNDAGQVQSYNPASTTGEQALQDGNGTIGRLNLPPAGWESFYPATGGNLTQAGKTVVNVYTASGVGNTVGIGDFSSGAITPLPPAPVNGDDDWSPRISAEGNYVVVQAGAALGQLEPYLYDSSGGWQALGNLADSGDGRPLAVNSAGTVVGRTGSGDASGNTVPFIWKEETGMQAITENGTPVFGGASAINDAGLVTGTANGRAFVFDGGTMELTWITPVANQRAVDINNAGQIIGEFNFGPLFGVPGDTGWIATVEDGWVQLTSLIPGNLESGEWSINNVSDINDEGWILATAYNYPEQRSHQVLLCPVPEPSAAVLAGLGSLWWISRRWRDRR